MIKQRSYMMMALAALALAGTASCKSDPSAPPDSNQVTISDNLFGPAILTVPVGTTVRWVNNGAAIHDVAAFGGAFNSGPIAAGRDFKRVFPARGNYEYACTRHSGMQGQIVVQ